MRRTLSSPWRPPARLAIAGALAASAAEGLEGKAIAAAVRKAYPFGERKHWPYKVWLDEVRMHLAPECLPALRGGRRRRTLPAFLPGQGWLPFPPD